MNGPLLPEDSLDDPELGFGFDEELVAEPLMPAVHDVEIANEPEPLTTDANVPLDVEPDPELGSQVEFTDEAPPLDEPEVRPDDSDKLRLELKSLRTELEGLRAERDELAAANRDLTGKLESAVPAGEIERFEGLLGEARKNHSSAEAEVARLKAELDAARREVVVAAAEAPPETRRELDVMDAQIKALQVENTQLKDALKEAQGAENRTEHAHDELARRVRSLEAELEDLRAELQAAAAKLEERISENEQLSRELAVARKALIEQRDASDEVERKSRELDDRKAELDAVTKALADARLEIERMTPFEAEVARVEGLEDRISELQEALVAKEKETAEMQEKLDSEAARSYRLSQRRIPMLNAELEQAQESSRELERKLQKAELRANTFEEKVRELENQQSELQRALQAAKARAQDTAIIQQGDTRPEALVEDEVRRLTNRLRDLESERTALQADLRKISDAQRTELEKHSTRADRLEAESDERYESLLKQRTLMRVMRERMNGMLKLAEDLNATAQGQRQPLLEALRKLADVPPEAN